MPDFAEFAEFGGRLNRQKDSFEIIIPAGKDLLQSGKADTIGQLGKGSADRLLLTGTHGVYIFDSKNQKIEKYFIHAEGNVHGLPDSTLAAAQDLKGQIWVVHRHGQLSLIDPASGNMQTFTYGTNTLRYQKDVREISVFFPSIQNKNGVWFQALGNDLLPKGLIRL